MTRVIHTGDTHLGYRQYHAAERREDFLEAFRQVIEDAIEMSVDAVVHAGDFFHDARPDLPDLLAALDALRDLAAADIPFLAIVGNHERTRDRQWLDLFAELDLAVRLDADGHRIGDVTFYGLDYVPSSQRDTITLDVTPSATAHTTLVAHGLFEPFAHAEWDTGEFLAQLPLDLDALLLGDNHEYGQTRIGETLVTYCGSTERTSAAEEAERGYNLVTFADGEVTVTRRSLDVTRRFEYIEVELASDEGLERVTQRIDERDLTDAVAIIRINGGGGDVTPAAVEEHALAAGAIVARVEDARETKEDPGADVNFADPGRAVDERLRSMELSAAAHDVESIVRDDGIADANVRERVTNRVGELLDDGQLAAFQAASGTPPEPASPTDSADDPAGNTEAAPTEQTESKPNQADDTSGEEGPESQRSLMEY